MEHRIDAIGMKCPRPIVELAKMRRRAEAGDILEIEADDLAFANDVVAWCEATQSELLELDRRNASTWARIRLSGEGA